MSQERTKRILEPLERLIQEGSTQGERDAAKNRWEHITNKKWEGKSSKRETNSNPWSQAYQKEDDDIPFSDVYGFDGFEDFIHKASSGSDWFRDYIKKQAEAEKSKKSTRYDYDFTFNQCTESQYTFLDDICNFFRWKHPLRNYISFEEASEFLAKYSDVFKSFNYNYRTCLNLKKLFETFDVPWEAVNRTFTWEYEKKGGHL